MTATSELESLASPDWLLAGFDNEADRFHFARVSRQTYRDSAFLDHRIQPRPVETMSLSGSQIDKVSLHSRVAQSAWIFHTGFCCSTLLATCLDCPGSTLVLREPKVLALLAQANRHNQGRDLLLQRRVIGICERSYPGESLLIKPSNFANNLIEDLFPSTPQQPLRKAILMTSSLDSLLISILKKKSEAEAALPGFLQALLQDSDYLAVVGISDTSKLDLLQQSVLFWHCQRYLLQQRMAASGTDQFMQLSMEHFLTEPEAVLTAVSRFLELKLPGEVIRQTVESGAFRRHSKQAVAAYGPDEYQQEQRQIRKQYAHEITAALTWAKPLLQRLPIAPFDEFDPDS